MPDAVLAARTAADLAAAVAAGGRLRHLAFWGHRERRPGEPGPWYLSQWWPGTFEVDGVAYASAEHWMMAGKARLFGDHATLAKILAAPSPGAAKGLGRRVARFDDATWTAHRYELVVRGNVAKFGQDPALRGYLLGTAGRVLIEASPLDRIWGIGLAADDRRVADPAAWNGLNLLGFALMDARDRLPQS